MEIDINMSKSSGSKKDKGDKGEDKDVEKPIVAKTAYDLQRLKLMKLMKNPVSTLDDRFFFYQHASGPTFM